MLLLYAQAGEISPEQLEFLVDNLEEEWPDDRDYYINRDLLKILENAGADIQLLALLERCLGDRDEVDILWMDTEATDDSLYRDLDADWDHDHIYSQGGEHTHSHEPGQQHSHAAETEHDHMHEDEHEHGPGSSHTH
jgi:hypothetical protein